MKGRASVVSFLTVLVMCLALPVGAFAQEKSIEGAASYPEGLIHTVVEGDTLWDLSAEYLGSPWKWPELWERNRFLTNPHYIYPGVQIVIFPPPAKEYALPAAEAPAAAPPAPAAAAPAKEAAPITAMLDITPSEYVRAGEFRKEMPKGVGRILFSVEPKVAFSEGDRVILQADKDLPAGQLLGVYRVRGPITAPGDRHVTGFATYLVGLVQVKGKENGEVVAVVRNSFEDMSREDQLREEIPSYAPVPLSPGAPGLAAGVISGQWENEELAAGNFIFLDRGSADGIAVGNVFRLLDGMDRTSGGPYGGNTRVRVDVGQAVVVRVSPEFSTAYINKSLQSFPAGITAIRGTDGVR